MKTKKKRRLSPILAITLPPLTKLEVKRQADARQLTVSRHIANMIEKQSWEDGQK